MFSKVICQLLELVLQRLKNIKIMNFTILNAWSQTWYHWTLQVSGRSDITDFGSKGRLDMKYIQGWSITQDIKIIAKTFAVVLKREGSRANFLLLSSITGDRRVKICLVVFQNTVWHT